MDEWKVLVSLSTRPLASPSLCDPVHDVRLLFTVLHGGQMSIRPHHFSFFFSLVHALFDRSILDRPLSSTTSIRRGNTHKSSLVSHRNGVVLYNIIDRHKSRNGATSKRKTFWLLVDADFGGRIPANWPPWTFRSYLLFAVLIEHSFCFTPSRHYNKDIYICTVYFSTCFHGAFLIRQCRKVAAKVTNSRESREQEFQ